MKKLLLILLLLIPLFAFPQAEKTHRSVVLDSIKALTGGIIDVKDTLSVEELILVGDVVSIGKISGTSAFFSHKDNLTLSNYALFQTANGSTGVNAKSGQTVTLNIANSPKLTLDANGDVGIGLGSPAEKLEVNGNIRCDTLFSDLPNIFSVSDTIFSADILTLNGSPVTIVAAPGSGKIVEAISWSTQIIFNSAAYVTNTTLQVITNTAAEAQFQNSDILKSTGSRFTRGGIQSGLISTSNTQLVANQALTINVETGNPATGDSDIIYFITYRIITL